MVILGLLLFLAMVGISLALVWANDSIFTAPAATVELLGDSIEVTMGQVFLAGFVAGALALLGLVMLLNGLGRNARRRSTARHQLRDHRQEIQDLQRKHVANEDAADSEGITTRR